MLLAPVPVLVLASAAGAPAFGATTTVRLDARPRAAVNAAGHLWVLADRGEARVLMETGALTGLPTGREVTIVAAGTPGWRCWATTSSARP